MGRKLNDRQMRCVDEFRDAVTSAETDEDLGRALLELYLKLGGLQRGVETDDFRRGATDAETLLRLKDLTELPPELSVFEGFSRRLVTDPKGAMRYLSNHVSARDTKQSQRAQKPRRRDIFSQRIDELVEDHPQIKAKKVEALLLEMGGITLIDGELRHTETAATMRQSNLAERVSEAKKRHKKDSGQPG